MSKRTLIGLLRASGLTSPQAGQSLRNSVNDAVLPNGANMREYVIDPTLTVVSEDPMITTNNLLPNFQTLTVVMSYAAQGGPTSRLATLGPKSAQILITNEQDDFGTSRPSSIVYNPTPTINTTAQTVTWSGIIQNTREVTAWGNEGAGDAWHSFDIRFRFNNDNDMNDPADILITGVRVRTLLAGQGTPSTPPATPSAPTILYPDPALGVDWGRATVSAGWFGLGSSNIQIQWSTTSDFSSVVGSGEIYQFFTGNDPNFAITLYVRARIIDPFTGPWTDAASIFYEDPRPDV